MQHSLGVTMIVSYLTTLGISPETELVLTETMGTQDLFLVFIPKQRADLTIGVNSVNQLPCFNVPEPHGLV